MIYNGNGEEKAIRSIAPFHNGFLHISYSRFLSYGPHNTKAVFESSGFLGFDAIKGDVRISADNVLIMCHDAGYTLDSNGKIAVTHDSNNEIVIRNMQSADILALKHSLYEMDEPPCTADDYLRICAKWGKIPFVTVRDEYMDIIAPLLIEALERWNLIDRAIINSFTVASLEKFRALNKRLWLNVVMGRTLTESDLATAEELYPCALSPYRASTTATAAELQADYDAMVDIITECRAKGIPILTAGTYNREQYNFHLSHYNGAQMNSVIDFAPRKKYFIPMRYTGGAWEFYEANGFEHSGTITADGGYLYVQSDQIVPTWYAKLSPEITAKCVSDSSVTISARYWNNLKGLRVEVPSATEGMKILITIEF